MSIAAMKRACLFGLARERDDVMKTLARLGCVQLLPQYDKLSDPDWAAISHRAEAGSAELKNALSDLKNALDILQRTTGRKRGLLSPRPEYPRARFDDDAANAAAANTAAEINRLHKRIQTLTADEGRLQIKRAALAPWKSLNLPLGTLSSEHCSVQFGTAPATADTDAARAELAASAPCSELIDVNSDNEQRYLLFICHNDSLEHAAPILKNLSFSRVQFKDTQTTALAAITEIDAECAALTAERAACADKIKNLDSARADIEIAADAVLTKLARAEASERMLATNDAFYLEAWIPASDLAQVENALKPFTCALETRDPLDDEEPPVFLKNSKLVQPFHMVSKMYSLPAYRNIDPNPLIAPFYAVFFGMMYADVAYGLALVAISLFVTRKLKPKGPMVRYMFPLMGICGIFSVIFGLLYGSFFSDALGAVTETFFGTRIDFPHLWIDPLKDPMSMLIFAVILGVIHIITGMAVKAFILIRDGKPWDALMDVGSWWLLFAGVAVLALGGGYYVMLAGFAALILTQGRAGKSIFAKLFGGLASLYGVTGYLSDLLSYSRLMALGLAGGVLGMVFNTMGTMLGASIPGFIFFLAIFAFGHAFNMAISVIGTYVHAARLQYVEYFGKFYVAGGTEFAPLKTETVFVDLLDSD